MISIRYTAPRDLELEGSRSDLEFVAGAVSQLAPTAGAAVRFLAQPIPDPAPYAKSLAMLRIRVDDGPLHILVLGSHMVVTGDAFGLEAFTSVLRAAAGASPGTRAQLEYIEGHPRIDTRSLPLVVSHRK